MAHRETGTDSGHRAVNRIARNPPGPARRGRKWGRKDLFIDLGAEILAAEKGSVRIAVEVKSFAGPSEVGDLEKALGQFTLYHDVLAIREPDRVLYLAISLDAFQDVFEEGPGKLLLENNRVRLLTFNPAEEVIITWLPSTPIEILSSGS